MPCTSDAIGRTERRFVSLAGGSFRLDANWQYDLNGKATFTYDANGNLTDGDGRHIDFDDFDRPVKITMGSVTTYFRYAPDGSRYLQQTTTSSGSAAVTKTVYD